MVDCDREVTVMESSPKSRINFAQAEVTKLRRRSRKPTGSNKMQKKLRKSKKSASMVSFRPVPINTAFVDNSNLETQDIIAKNNTEDSSGDIEISTLSPRKQTRDLLCKMPFLPLGVYYLDKEFLGLWSWGARLDVILSHVYGVINGATGEIICTGLRISDGEILVPGHFDPRTMQRSVLQRLPEVPKTRKPNHIHNYYSPRNAAATLFMLHDEDPTYSFYSSSIRRQVDASHSLLIYAWKRNFVVSFLSSLSDPAHPAYSAAGAICVTLVPESNRFVVSGMYLGEGKFLSDSDLEAFGIVLHSTS